MTISSLGIGSGLDIGGLVTKLVTAQYQPQSDRLDRLEAGIQSRISGFATLKGALSSFQSSLSSLQNVDGFGSKLAVSSDESIVKATSSNAALVGSYDISVSQLASSHKLATDPLLPNAQFTSTSDTLSTGTLTFKFGTTDYDKGSDTYNSFTQNADIPAKNIEITDSSLQGIRDAVNNANIGVSASIVFDGTNYRLAFVSQSGADNSIEITVSDDDGNDSDDSGLSLLSFNSTATHLEQTDTAQNTLASVNGIAVTSSSNKLAGAIEGVTLEILKAGTATVSVDTGTESVKSNITNFVDSYNSLVATINDLGSYNPDTGESGLLIGDSLLRSVNSQLSRILGNPVTGITGSVRILADIGITRDAKSGKLVIDSTKLDNTIADNFGDITSLFSAIGSTDDSLVSFDSSTDATKVGRYDINISQLATQGNYAGSSAANLTITSGVNDELNITVDGVSAFVTISAGTYTATSLVSELQSRINGATEFGDAGISIQVTQSSGILTLTSNKYGSSSNVEITGGNGKTDLIGATPVKTDGLDVAGTIGGVYATGSGQYLSGSGDAQGLKLLISGGATGDRGAVNFTRGYANLLNDQLSTFLGTDNIFDSMNESLQSSVDRINDQRDEIDARASSLQSRLLAQFNAMDALVGRLQSTGSYLTQQLDILGTISANK